MNVVQEVIFRLSDGQLGQNGTGRVDFIAVGIRMTTGTTFLLVAIVVAEESELGASLFVDVGLSVQQFMGLVDFLFLYNSDQLVSSTRN